MITVDFHKLGIRPGYRALDIGCGSGRHAARIAQYNDVATFAADVRFDDLCETRRRLALHENLGEKVGPCHLLAADIRRLPFGDCFFDLIICSEVLEHIIEQKTAAAELVRILKPGGVLAVSVPRFWPEKICWKLSGEYRTSADGHIRIYRQTELIAFLKTAGFHPRAFHWAHSLHTPYWWLKCLIGPSKDGHPLVRLYHRFLTWDLMKRPRLTRFLDRLLNPLLGKSLVVYAEKQKNQRSAVSSQ